MSIITLIYNDKKNEFEEEYLPVTSNSVQSIPVGDILSNDTSILLNNGQHPQKQQKQQKQKNKCNYLDCNNKLNYIEKNVGTCICKDDNNTFKFFCSEHKYKFAHNCTEEDKCIKNEREQLIKKNQKCVKDKITKI